MVDLKAFTNLKHLHINHLTRPVWALEQQINASCMLSHIVNAEDQTDVTCLDFILS